VKLAFIGGGMMGEAIIAGAIARDITSAGDISVCEVVSARRKYLQKHHGVTVTDDPLSAIEHAGVIVLAVKPQEFARAAEPLAGKLKKNHVLMSIMAGVTIDSIREAFRHDAVVRSIPNTPAQIGEGVTVWTATDSVPASARDWIRTLLSVMGAEIYVSDEKYIDMATAVSSSGPAYVFLVIEAMIDAAVHIGLRREMAVPMVLQTVLGSSRYALETGRHPAELRNQVTSPGGTTTEGLLALEAAGLRAAFTDAIEAAFSKAKELGG
jgi:pyrroline-5-carboxylate reductase